jgi:hypothetical protein
VVVDVVVAVTQRVEGTFVTNVMVELRTEVVLVIKVVGIVVVAVTVVVTVPVVVVNVTVHGPGPIHGSADFASGNSALQVSIFEPHKTPYTGILLTEKKKDDGTKNEGVHGVNDNGRLKF